MDIANEIKNILEQTKELTVEVSQNNKEELLMNDFITATTKAVDSASRYIIKAMPVPEAIKDVLLDVKDSLKTRDLKEVLTTAVKSAIREGLEIMGISQKAFNSLQEIKEVCKKGGFVTAVKNGIQIVASSFLKNNIVGDYVYTFFDKLEAYVMNKDFMKKVEQTLSKFENKKEDFMKKCDEWYNAYREMDVQQMNRLSEKINKDIYVTSRYKDCLKENKLIQNMTAMINSTNKALSQEQQTLCQVL